MQVFLKEALISSQPDIMGGGSDAAAGMKTSTRTVQMAVVFISVVPVLMIYPSSSAISSKALWWVL